MNKIITKNRIIIIIAFLTLLSCMIYFIPQREPEIVRVHTSRILYNNLNELLKVADAVVIGEFVENTTQSIEYTINSELKEGVVINAISHNFIFVKKILKGDVDSLKIKVSQRYGIDENHNQFITFSEMTPMNKGDEWIFFLYYDDIYDTYWCAGDYTGRYPIPDEKLLSIRDEVSKIVVERNKWLNSKEVISDSEIESRHSKGDIIYIDRANINYILQSEKDVEKVTSYNIKIEDCRNELEAFDFGLYDKESINIELYLEILEYFDLIHHL